MMKATVEVIMNGERHVFEHANSVAMSETPIGATLPNEVRVRDLTTGETIIYPITNVLRFYNRSDIVEDSEDKGNG